MSSRFVARPVPAEGRRARRELIPSGDWPAWDRSRDHRREQHQVVDPMRQVAHEVSSGRRRRRPPHAVVDVKGAAAIVADTAARPAERAGRLPHKCVQVYRRA